MKKPTKNERKWFADIEAAERYRQAVAGNQPYCTWPTYEKPQPEERTHDNQD